MTTIKTTTVNGEVVTSSLNISDVFSKRHKDVIRSIRNMKCSDDFRRRNFTPSSYVTEQGKELTRYNCTKDGTVMLVMGYTGSEAIKFKEAYIAAFNQMEAKLLTKPTTITPAQQRLIQERVSKLAAEDKAYSKYYGVLKSHFRVAKYNQIPSAKLEEALAVLDGVVVTPPAIKTQSTIDPRPKEGMVTISRHHLSEIISLIEIYREAYDIVNGLESAITVSAKSVRKYRYRTHDAVIDAANCARSLKHLI